MSLHTQSIALMQVISRVLFHFRKSGSISTIYLCDLPVAAPVTGIGRAALNRNLFGLSTSEVFPAVPLLKLPVSSYLTFSLSPRGACALKATLFSVALSVTKAFLL